MYMYKTGEKIDRALNSGFSVAAELLLHIYCTQCIISLSKAVMEVNFSIKESSINRQRKLILFIFNF